LKAIFVTVDDVLSHTFVRRIFDSSPDID